MNMSYERILFFLGIWIALLSFLGFPVSVRRILFIISGLGVCFIAYVFYKKSIRSRPDIKIKENNTPTIESI